MLLRNARIEMKKSNVSFVANSCPLSGGLTVIKTKLYAIHIDAEFVGNHGSDGGGLSLYEGSIIYFFNYSFLRFNNNTASRKDGAIFVEDSDYINSHTKNSQNLRALLFWNGNKVDLEFSDNQATVAGNEIYGGWIDILDYGRMMYNISQDNNDLSTV